MWGVPWSRGRSPCKQLHKAARSRADVSIRKGPERKNRLRPSRPLSCPFCAPAYVGLALVGAGLAVLGDWGALLSPRWASRTSWISLLISPSIHLFPFPHQGFILLQGCSLQALGFVRIKDTLPPWSICCETATDHACSGLLLRGWDQCQAFLTISAFS